MHLDQPLKRNPDEGCWVVFRPCPISRDGSVQLDERLGQHYSQTIIGNHAMDWRDASQSWQQKAGSLCHQLTGGSQPGGAAIGVRL